MPCMHRGFAGDISSRHPDSDIMHFRRFKNVVGDREKRDIGDDHADHFLRLTDGTFL